MSRLGLHGRFVVLVALLVVGFGAVVTVLAVRIQNERLRLDLVARGRLLTSLVGADAADALVRLDIQDLRGLLGEVSSQPDVVSAEAFDPECRILTDGTVANPDRYALLPENERQHVRARDDLLVEVERGQMSMVQPVRVGRDLVGGVRIRLSLDRLGQERARLTTRTAVVAGVFIFLGVVASAFLARTVTRPIGLLVDATHALARGETPTPIPITSGNEVGHLAASFNEMIARLRETTISRDYLRQVLHNMGESIFVLWPDGVVRRVNPATCALLGVPEDELVGAPFASLLRPVAECLEDPLRDALVLRASTQGVESALVARSGDRIPVIASFSAMSGGGEIEGFVCIARDLRYRLRIERMKDEFISIVNHELRTPLTSLRGSLGLLRGGVAGRLDPAILELVEIAERNSQRLQHLIDDLLDSQKLEAGQMPFRMRTTAIQEVVDRAVESVRGLGAASGVRIEISERLPGAEVHVDPDRLEQVVANLLSNAVRFSPDNGVVDVVVRPRDGWIRLMVADRGPGIPDGFRARVFEKFAQTEGSSRSGRSGTGLGLAITKGIVDRLGGAIGFVAREGGGTTFWVDLPMI